MKKVFLALIGIISTFLTACGSYPIDLYSIPISNQKAVILTENKLENLKSGFNDLCRRYSLDRHQEPKDLNNEYQGIWFLYTRGGKFDSREGVALLFERSRNEIVITVRTSGKTPEPDYIVGLKRDLLKMLQGVVGIENVKYDRATSSGIN